ncbi:MAG: helix-turn-helix domain-containing protein, partial [Cyanobacteria bacterium P01_F01_bin.53]
MPSAIAMPIRRQIVSLYQAGKSYREIAEALGQSRHSVRRICRQWRDGDPDLRPHYDR